MMDGLYLSANVYDVDGILAAAFVGDYATLKEVFATSCDDKHCPPYYQKRIHDGFVKITDYQLIISDNIVPLVAYAPEDVVMSDLVLPFTQFIRGDFDGDEPLGAVLECAFEYRREFEENKNG